jgi:predicted PurR-regulated permease PerM
MKYIKLAIISFIFLFIVVTLMALLLPSTVIVSRAIDINANIDTIKNYTLQIKNWQTWLPEKNSHFSIENDSTVLMAKTRILVEIKTDSSINTKWIGEKGTIQNSRLQIIAYNNSNITTVQWQFTEKLKWYPWQRFGSIVNEAVMGNALEKKLQKLKTICEED